MATVTPLSVIPSEAPAPGFTAGARILAEEGFNADLILWIFASTPEIASPLAAAMEELAWADPVTVARQWEASGRRG